MRQTVLTSILFATLAIAQMPPALAQSAIATVRPTPSISNAGRFLNRRPGFINNLAAARAIGLTNAQAGQFKGAAMKKFVAGLTGPKSASTAGAEPEIEVSNVFGIQPVAYIPRVPAVLQMEQTQFGSLRFVRTPVYDVNGEGLDVHSGSLLVETSAACRLTVPGGIAELAPGALVKVMASEDGSSIINITDKRRDSVKVRVCKKSLQLNPGQECTFSLSREFLERKRADGCGRRDAHDASCCTYSIKLNEVSVGALLKHDPIGRQIYLSENSAEKRLTSRILKTAVALAHASKTKTAYTWD